MSDDVKRIVAIIQDHIRESLEKHIHEVLSPEDFARALFKASLLSQGCILRDDDTIVAAGTEETIALFKGAVYDSGSGNLDATVQCMKSIEFITVDLTIDSGGKHETP